MGLLRKPRGALRLVLLNFADWASLSITLLNIAIQETYSISHAYIRGRLSSGLLILRQYSVI